MEGWEDLELDEDDQSDLDLFNEETGGGRAPEEGLSSQQLHQIVPFQEFETEREIEIVRERNPHPSGRASVGEKKDLWPSGSATAAVYEAEGRKRPLAERDENLQGTHVAPTRDALHQSPGHSPRGERKSDEAAEEPREVVLNDDSRADCYNQQPPQGRAVVDRDLGDCGHVPSFPSDSRVLPGPIGQLQKAWSKRSQKRITAQQTETVLHVATVSAKDEVDLIRSMQDEADFQSTSWRRALDALDIVPSSVLKEPVFGSDIRSISDGKTGRKIAKLLGLVKHFEMGGDGNAFIILKDPSGSIGATIHGDALKVEKGIKVGSVLVLEKVSLFSADGRTQVLCITLDNLLQIF